MSLAINRWYAEYNESNDNELPKPRIYWDNLICNWVPMDRSRINSWEYCDSKCYRDQICRKICALLQENKRDEAIVHFNSYIK